MGTEGTFGERPEIEALATLLGRPIEMYYYLPAEDRTGSEAAFKPKEVIHAPDALTKRGDEDAAASGGGVAAATSVEMDEESREGEAPPALRLLHRLNARHFDLLRPGGAGTTAGGKFAEGGKTTEGGKTEGEKGAKGKKAAHTAKEAEPKAEQGAEASATANQAITRALMANQPESTAGAADEGKVQAEAKEGAAATMPLQGISVNVPRGEAPSKLTTPLASARGGRNEPALAAGPLW